MSSARCRRRCGPHGVASQDAGARLSGGHGGAGEPRRRFTSSRICSADRRRCWRAKRRDSISWCSMRRISMAGPAIPISAPTARTGPTMPSALPRFARAAAEIWPRRSCRLSFLISSMPMTGRRRWRRPICDSAGMRREVRHHHPQPGISGAVPSGHLRHRWACRPRPMPSTASNIMAVSAISRPGCNMPMPSPRSVPPMRGRSARTENGMGLDGLLRVRQTCAERHRQRHRHDRLGSRYRQPYRHDLRRQAPGPARGQQAGDRAALRLRGRRRSHSIASSAA